MGMLCFFPDCWFRNPADQMIWKISHFSSGYMSRYLYIYILYLYIHIKWCRISSITNMFSNLSRTCSKIRLVFCVSSSSNDLSDAWFQRAVTIQ